MHIKNYPLNGTNQLYSVILGLVLLVMMGSVDGLSLIVSRHCTFLWLFDLINHFNVIFRV